MKKYDEETEQKVNEIRNKIADKLIQLLNAEHCTIEQFNTIIKAYEVIY